jgi:hypothetical protein
MKARGHSEKANMREISKKLINQNKEIEINAVKINNQQQRC